MKHKAQFGSISSGTMRSEDLIPTFASELRDLRGSLPKDLHNDIRKWEAGTLEDCEPEDIVDSLFDALDGFAPPYGHFGAHPGDGVDFGFWLQEDWQRSMREDGVLEVSDWADVPDDYVGEVLHVSDHGNASFYVRNKNGTLTEIWSVV